MSLFGMQKKRKMIKVFLDFAGHVKDSDINDVVEKMKTNIRGLEESAYPFAKMERVEGMDYHAQLSEREAVFYVYDYNTKKLLFTDHFYIKEVDGEVRVTLVPMPLGAVSYGEGGVPLSEVYDKAEVKEVKKTNRVSGTLDMVSKDFVSLYPVYTVRLIPEAKEEAKQREAGA